MPIKSDYAVMLVNGGLGLTTTISNGQTTSTLFDAAGSTVLGLRIPSSWTAGNISFLEIDQTGVSRTLTDTSGNSFSLTANAGTTIPVPVEIFKCVQYFQIVSSVSQGADRSIQVILGPVFQGL